jgi:cbb3-type cytochrome oxidase maturation protein
MFYPFFIAYIVVGFIVTLCVFLWALRSGQFRDQQRARFLPLVEEGEKVPVKVSKFNRYQAYGLFGLLLSGLLAGASIVIYALTRGG